MKYKVMDVESPKYGMVGRLYSVNTFIDSGEVMFTLEFEGRRFGSYDFNDLEIAI